MILAFKIKKDQEVEFQKLSTRIEKLNQKVALLGTLFNENVVILKGDLDKQDLLTIERGWKIKKMPKYLKLEENDQTFLNSLKNER